MTNGDKVRAMTNEELIDNKIIDVDKICPPDGRDCLKNERCRECWLIYLAQEESEE